MVLSRVLISAVVTTVLLWIAPLGPALGSASLTTNTYTVFYQGVFSLGRRIPIADLVLESGRRDPQQALDHTRIAATSAGYPMVESLYPIRYRFRNWAAADGRLLAFETYQKGSREKHRLYLPNADATGFERHDLLKQQGSSALARLEQGMAPADAATAAPWIDRLSLLQRIRALPLGESEEYRFQVTDGRDVFDYQVRVENAQALALAGSHVAAWKLRIDGRNAADAGEQPGQPVHRPVYVWLSQTPDRAPLRIESRHAVGVFRIEHKADGLPGRLAGEAARAVSG